MWAAPTIRCSWASFSSCSRAPEASHSTLGDHTEKPLRMADSAQPVQEVATPGGRGSLRELAFFFLRLGFTAFGGPAAHIAMMEDELVRRRKWLSREKFLDVLGASNLIPGPSSSELAIHIGYLRGGWAGLLIGGACFILPATILVGTIVWTYARFGHLPQVSAVLYGVKPVVIAVILQALWGLGRTAVKSKLLAFAGAVCVVCSALGVNLILILFGAGAAVAMIHVALRSARQP